MGLDEFQEIVNRAAARLPRKFRNILNREGIELLAREKVPRAARGKPGMFTFGMFVGEPLSDRSVFKGAAEPTRIELYKESFEAAFRDRAEMEREIAATVAHEVGHYFGFTERQLRNLMGE